MPEPSQQEVFTIENCHPVNVYDELFCTSTLNLQVPVPALQEAAALGVRLQGVRRRGRQGPRREEADCHPIGPATTKVTEEYTGQGFIISHRLREIG